LSNFSVYDAQIDLSPLTKNSKNDSKIVGISLFHAALVDAVDNQTHHDKLQQEEKPFKDARTVGVFAHKRKKTTMSSSNDQTHADVARRIDLATSKLKHHGLTDWRIGTDKARARAGACHFGTRTITLSKFFLSDPRTTDAEVLNTVLHEIAHVLGGPHHDDRWRTVALAIGCDGRTCFSRSIVKEKWRLHCPCGTVDFLRHVVKDVMLTKSCTTCLGKLVAVKNV
jgi:predicted SprT family Zn-dependent metalloprotease